MISGGQDLCRGGGGWQAVAVERGAGGTGRQAARPTAPRAAGEAGGFNEEQKLLTAQGRMVIVSDG